MCNNPRYRYGILFLEVSLHLLLGGFISFRVVMIVCTLLYYVSKAISSIICRAGILTFGSPFENLRIFLKVKAALQGTIQKINWANKNYFCLKMSCNVLNLHLTLCYTDLTQEIYNTNIRGKNEENELLKIVYSYFYKCILILNCLLIFPIRTVKYKSSLKCIMKKV